MISDRLKIQPVGQLDTIESIYISYYNGNITYIVAMQVKGYYYNQNMVISKRKA